MRQGRFHLPDFKPAFLVVLLLASVAVLLNACGGGSPTTPAPPTATDTPCGYPGDTCTWTSTATPTSTATNTMTLTRTNSPTETDTFTPTLSPTVTDTPTVTRTPTATFTASSTATLTDSPTITDTTAFTFTATHTRTFTATFTRTSTFTATATLTPGACVRGSITYSGSLAAVGINHPLFLGLSQSSSFAGPNYSQGAVTVNGAGYNLASPGTGSVYLSYYFYAATGVTCEDLSGMLVTGPIKHQGDPYQSYNANCSLPVDPIPGTSPQTINLSFGDSCRMPGISGMVNYTGSLGSVSAGHDLHVRLYTDSSYSALAVDQGLTCNNTHYNVGLNGGGISQYLQAYYDADGSGDLSAGDPSINVGQVTLSTTANADIQFGDTAPTQTATPSGTQTPTGSISGTLTYTGGPVNGSNPIVVMAAGEDGPTTFDSEGGFGYTYTVTNGGSYTLANLPANTYIVQAYNAPGGTFQPGVPMELYGASGCVTGSSSYITVGSGNVPNINFNFGNTNRMYGVSGGITYTGSYTYNSNSQYQLVVVMYDNSAYENNRNSNWTQVASDASVYAITTPLDSGLWCSPLSVYVRAWVTLNACGETSHPCTGDPYWQGGPYTTSASLGNLSINFDDSQFFP